MKPPFDIAGRVRDDLPFSREEGRAVLRWLDEGIWDLLAAAFRVRKKHFGLSVKLHYLVNLQSGICPEDCAYCSQSRVSKAPVAKYPLIPVQELLAAAGRAVRCGAKRLCMAASMRGPADRDVEAVAGMIETVRARHPSLELCVSMGFLKEGQAERLRRAGVMAYNHNVNTGPRFYGKICSTYGYNDRLATARRAVSAGVRLCSGVLLGMGESEDDVLDSAEELRNLKVSSIPVNFLIPVPGTRLEGRPPMSPLECLKVLCLFRFFFPSTEVRAAGGRHLSLRTLQPLALCAVNSIFIGDYLTTRGMSPEEDLAMIRDAGFEVAGVPSLAEREPLSGKVEVLPARPDY